MEGEAVAGLIMLGIVIFLIYIVFAILVFIVKLAISLLILALALLIVAVIPVAIGWIAYETYKAFIDNEFENYRAIIFPALTVITAASLSLSYYFPYSPPLLVFLLVACGGSLVGGLAYPYIRRRQLIKKYQEEEKYLIEP
ncbi:MAG: hypothetical protein ACXITR_00585 [Cyanobacterium sp.]